MMDELIAYMTEQFFAAIKRMDAAEARGDELSRMWCSGKAKGLSDSLAKAGVDTFNELADWYTKEARHDDASAVL